MADRGPSAALVTGAAHRIGRAIALDLAKAGWAVAVHYKESEEAADTTAAEIGASGGRAQAIHADLALAAAKRAVTEGADLPLAAALELERRLAAGLSV